MEGRWGEQRGGVGAEKKGREKKGRAMGRREMDSKRSMQSSLGTKHI